MARHEKVDYCHFLIFGGPGETRGTLKLSFENSQRLDRSVILAVVGMRIYPGTPLYERARREGIIWSGTELLQPWYYLSPALTEDEVFERLHEFARLSPAWIIGDPTPLYRKLSERLRAKGIVGPLWNHFATMQQLAGASHMGSKSTDRRPDIKPCLISIHFVMSWRENIANAGCRQLSEAVVVANICNI